MLFVVFFTLIIVLTAMLACAKYNARKSQETCRRASIEKEFMKAEKERQNARKIEETEYLERDEKEYEDEYSDDSDDQ